VDTIKWLPKADADAETTVGKEARKLILPPPLVFLGSTAPPGLYPVDRVHYLEFKTHSSSHGWS
jgi:hypothetical protein